MYQNYYNIFYIYNYMINVQNRSLENLLTYFKARYEENNISCNKINMAKRIVTTPW